MSRWRGPVSFALAVSVLVAVWVSEPARAAGWHSAQPAPPAPLEGESSVGVPVALGHIGDIEFWAPNRGLLITAGNEAIPAGLYSYNGVAWHELSTVCGGTEGRIAWAGPDDFWTISDQQAGQQIGLGNNGTLEGQDRALCHFVNGQVVASYAEPIGVPGSYQRMDAAACSAPDDCWFGGERLPAGVNSGAFHLHWNGLTLTPTPSLVVAEPQLQDPARTISAIASYKGHFYESAQIQQDDPVSDSESSSQPYLLHKIVEGTSTAFTPLLPEGPGGEPITYGTGEVKPWQLSAFRLSGDSSGLWAVAGPDGEISRSGSAQVTALLLRSNVFQQVELDDPSGVFTSGAQVDGVAAEPETTDAWVSLSESSGPEAGSAGALARVARVQANGSVEPEAQLPESGEALGHKGSAGAIACPAQGNCWIATTQGWLFHLGGDYAPDTDPNFQTLITSRPPDASLPFVPSDEAPPDDSGANPSVIPPQTGAQPLSTQASPRVHEPLFSKVKARLVRRTTLVLTFTLATKSHVRLLALHNKRDVAATKRLVLAGGFHTLKLRLSPSRWPTKLDLQVEAIGLVPLAPAGSGAAGPTGGPTIVGTSYRAPFSSALFAPLP